MRVAGPAAAPRQPLYPLGAVLRRKLPMLPQNFFLGLQFFGVPRPVRGDLRRCRSVKPLARRWSFTCSGVGCWPPCTLSCILDFWLSILAALDRVTEILEPDGQLRSVNIRGIAL